MDPRGEIGYNTAEVIPVAVLKERVDRLEEALMRLVYVQQKTEIEIQNLKEEMKAFKEEMRIFKDEMKAFKDEVKVFKDEMKAFKDEMKVFKDEMKVFKDEMLAFKDEMRVFKDEMKVFKDEMLAFKDEMKAFKDEMKVFKDEMLDFKEWSKKNIENLNRQWGHLANKLGTLVEDIFAPSIDMALEKYFGRRPSIVDVKKLVRKNGKSLELDILALYPEERRAFVVEAKADPDRTDYIDLFLKKLEEIPVFLPELAAYTVVGIYAALSMREETVRLLTRKGLYAMVVRGDIVEIINFDQVAERKNFEK